MKYAVEFGSSSMKYVPGFIKNDSGIQMLIGGVTQTGRRSHKPVLGK
jgi:hypothetical protein